MHVPMLAHLSVLFTTHKYGKYSYKVFYNLSVGDLHDVVDHLSRQGYHVMVTISTTEIYTLLYSDINCV